MADGLEEIYWFKRMNDRLVVARFKEELDWLVEVPEDIDIYVYNKGEDDLGEPVRNRCKAVEARKNFGREAETYLHHMIGHRPENPERFTIFCQGDPFEHSPDFLKLLSKREAWADVQALSYRWTSQRNIPPQELLSKETDQWIEECRVRREMISLHSLNALKFHDNGTVAQLAAYLGANALENGTNIAEHFFRSVKLEVLAQEAARSNLGQFCYGAIFAVKNDLLGNLPADALGVMQIKTRQHSVYAYIFERLWLHVFGLPFLKIQDNES